MVAYDEIEGHALISAGQPSRPGTDDCHTGNSMDDSGLWIFRRSPVRDETLVTNVRQIAQAVGFDITVLDDVNHMDCDYEEDSTTDLICQDTEISFSVWFGWGEKDCHWVDTRTWLCCWF